MEVYWVVDLVFVEQMRFNDSNKIWFIKYSCLWFFLILRCLFLVIIVYIFDLFKVKDNVIENFIIFLYNIKLIKQKFWKKIIIKIIRYFVIFLKFLNMIVE